MVVRATPDCLPTTRYFIRVAMDQQPDFRVISEGFGVLSDQFGRCANLPAIREGDVLNNILNGIREQLGGINARLGRVESRLERMETRSAAG